MPSVEELFDEHELVLKERKRKRIEELALKSTLEVAQQVAENANIVDDNALGAARPSDHYNGERRLRTLHDLLKMIDDSGFERSPQQVDFHRAFEQATLRVLFREDWAFSRPAILAKLGIEDGASEVMISTPRRFGKTFSVAMFCAAFCLAAKAEVVIFSPARRASRKILERIVEFVQRLGFGDKTIEYNQENFRLQNLDGSESLIRSFPSKVDVGLQRLPRS